MIIRNALIHDAIHEEPFYGDIVITDGRLVSVGGTAGNEDVAIDATGLHAYPGFVDAHSHIGLDAYGGPTGTTHDFNEMNDIVSPQLRGLDSYNPKDAAIPMALAGGVTTVAAGPGSANVFGGTFMAVKLYGNTVDEAVIDPEVAMKCAFGENPKRCYRDKCDSARMTTAAIFRQTLFEARDYMMRKEAAGDDITKRPKFDMKSEALIPVLKREMPLKAHAHRADDIMTALRIAREFDLRITIEHCTEGHLIVDELKEALSVFADSDLLEKIQIDFSVVSDRAYYNGVIFKGFISGVPDSVLSGGRYDKLLKRMKRKSKAVGFAVYLDMLERIDEEAQTQAATDTMLNVALPKGRLGEKVYAMFAAAGFPCPSILEPNRKLIFENKEAGVRYFWVKPSDVAIYVERGAADIGVAGKDILLEYEPEIYELLDLDIGKCRMAVAAPKDFEDDPNRTLRVATKFSKIAADHYASKGRDIDIVHLNGSIEIAPILGLTDVIVDIVETGATLKENNLEVKENIVPISARLIANKSSYKFKGDSIMKVASELKNN